MKVTLQFEGKSITVSAPSGFKVLVDDEVLLEHQGDSSGADWVEIGRKAYEKKCAERKECCQGTYGSCHGASSLFKEAQEEGGEEVVYINFEVPNSSFIETIRWWSYDEALGDEALEVHFKDGSLACYSDVPEYLIHQWIGEIKAGGSAGKFFNYNIKDEFEMIKES